MEKIKELNYKEIAPEDIDDICSFLNGIFKTQKFSKQYISNLYFLEDSVIGLNVFNGGRLIAHYCVVRRDYIYNGVEFKLGWSINTAVDPEFRGRGFFVDLASKTYELARKKGLVAIVGVANRNSTRLFLEKLGFEDKGIIRWNFDLFSKYEDRNVWPKSLSHLKSKTFGFNRSKYLMAFPVIKIYSMRNLSFGTFYLTNRRRVLGLGLSLPQSWFKSNWQVISLNLFPDDMQVGSFLKEFKIDIAESDTF